MSAQRRPYAKQSERSIWHDRDERCPTAKERERCLGGANSPDHQSLETQKSVRWPPAKRDGQPAQTVQQMPDAGRGHDVNSAARDDSWVNALATALTCATTQGYAITMSETLATGA